MTDPEPRVIDWHEEGKKAFVYGKVRQNKTYPLYPTQDIYTPTDEAAFIAGWRGAEAEWDGGKQLSGIEAYVQELREEEEARLRELA